MTCGSARSFAIEAQMEYEKLSEKLYSLAQEIKADHPQTAGVLLCLAGQAAQHKSPTELSELAFLLAKQALYTINSSNN
jgi:hypothetical protein